MKFYLIFNLLFKNNIVIKETYGKTGCRRVVPGHYLAADPKGRAVMIGTIFPLVFPF